MINKNKLSNVINIDKHPITDSTYRSEFRRKLVNRCSPKKLKMENGSLVLFRGKNAIHRVTPTKGDLTRILSVLAYNSSPNVKLSESARMTFFGKLN